MPTQHFRVEDSEMKHYSNNAVFLITVNEISAPGKAERDFSSGTAGMG